MNRFAWTCCWWPKQQKQWILFLLAKRVFPCPSVGFDHHAPNQTLDLRRIFPKCPACGHMEENLEAIRTEKFLNPLQRHPQQMTCGSCSTEYCTDCLLYGARFNEVHQGRNCRGSADDSRPFPNSRTCPICDYMTDKIDGCSFITCDKCLSHGCYACRVPRDLEMGRKIHRCFCRAPHTVPINGMTDTWLNDDGTRINFYDLPLRVSDDPNNVIWSHILFHWSKYVAVFPWAFCLKGSSTVVVRSMIFVARSSTL